MAASGAWQAPDTFVVKFCLYETPFYTTLGFSFDGAELRVRADPHVGFAPKQVVSLVGRNGS